MSQGRKTFSGQFYLLSIIGTALFFTVSSLANGFIWLYFITPLPVIYYMTVLGFDRGLKIIAYAALIAGLVTLATGESETLISAFSLVPTGAALALSIKRRERVCRSGVKAFIALGLTWVMLGLVFSAVNHQNMYSGMLQNIDAGLVNAFDAYSKAPDFPAKSRPELRAVFARMRHMVPKVFPGALVISAIFTIWLNMLLINSLLRRSQLQAWEEFQFWRLPDFLVWLLIGAILLLFGPSGFLPVLGINIVLALSALYFFQGLAVVTNLFGRWSIPRPIKFLIFFVITIQAYGIVLLAILGVADTWISFRKPKLNQPG